MEHAKWRGLTLPSRVAGETRTFTSTFGRFVAEPFESGYGTTIGNSIRRILLSSIEGAAATKVQIQGVEHEFSTIPGIVEDVPEILLNIKGVILECDSTEPKVITLSVQGPCTVTAADFNSDASVRIRNSTHVIAKITGNSKLEMSVTVERGRGYRPAAEGVADEAERIIGEIHLDATFSPVHRVRYKTEPTRVGQRTNFDRLIMDIWTDGTVTPELALVEAAKILRKHLNPFVMYSSAGDTVAAAGIAAEQDADADLDRRMNMRVSDLDLSVRASNCLESAGIRTVAELIGKGEDELLAIRAFGKTSMREVQAKLEEIGLTLGSPSQPESISPTA